MTGNLIFKERLPLPPSVNHYWRAKVEKVGRKYLPRFYKSIDAVAFRNKVYWQIKQARKSLNFEGPVKAVIVVHPKQRGTDLDNYTKGLFDALTYAKVYEDDKQVQEFHIKFGPVVKEGAVEIELWEIEA